ncbi:MAG: DMT family transporter, partial [Candidatus Saccharicenans sp.]
YSTFPIFTVFLEPLLLKSAFKKVNLILAIFCFLGVFLMVPEFKITNRFFLAIIWGVLAGLSFSFLTIINRKLSQKYSSLLVAFYQQTAAAIWLFPLFLWSKISLELNLKNLLWLIALGSICTAGAHTLFIKGLKYLEAQTSSLISALEPVYGVIFGYVLLKERPDLRTLSGGLLILGAVTAISIFNIKEKKDFLLIK